MKDWQTDVNSYMSKILTTCGRYYGKNLEGFEYEPGNYIPVDKRYSAMLSHEWATRSVELMEQMYNHKISKNTH